MHQENSKKTILLHIGQSKTGSSFVQSSFAIGKSVLHDNGIHYPISDNIAKSAINGEITSGNFWPREGEIEKLCDSVSNSPCKKILVSSESIFDILSNISGDHFLDSLKNSHSEVSFRVLCYVRDPLEHAVSIYQQLVKRGGFTAGFADGLKYYDIPSRSIQAFRRLKNYGAEITIFNYSRHRGHLLSTVERWLGLEEGMLPLPPKEIINRSLTNSELLIQRVMNEYFGEDARSIVSDPVCEKLPNIKSENPPISHSEMNDFIAKISSSFRDPEYLSYVPADEIPEIGNLSDYIVDENCNIQNRQFQISEDQIRIIATSMRNFMNRKIAASGNHPDPGPASAAG